jgi:triphosphatase
MARRPPPREREAPAAEQASPVETELKLALEASAVASLLRHPALRALRRGRTRTTHVVGTYFDSPDLRLERDAIALRVRRVGRRFTQTLKGPPQAGAGAGLHTRAEHEWPLRGPHPDLARLAGTPWKKAVAKAAKDGGLVPCCTTEFDRRTVPLEFPDGTTAELCVDLGERHAPDAPGAYPSAKSRSSSKPATRPTCFIWRSHCAPTFRSR